MDFPYPVGKERKISLLEQNPVSLSATFVSVLLSDNLKLLHSSNNNFSVSSTHAYNGLAVRAYKLQESLLSMMHIRCHSHLFTCSPLLLVRNDYQPINDLQNLGIQEQKYYRMFTRPFFAMDATNVHDAFVVGMLSTAALSIAARALLCK